MTRSGPAWMPPPGTISAHPAGEDWDAIVVPQTRGLDALQVLDHRTDRYPGPVIWEVSAPQARLYFLVPAGTSAEWTVEGTRACGRGTFIGVPGPTVIDPPGPHWLCPPDPDDPEGLVDADALRDALLLLAPGTAA